MRPFDLATFAAPLHVPELRSGPTVLRPFTLADLPLLREATSDPYIPTITSVPEAYSDDEGRAFIARQLDRAEGGHGYPFVIALTSEPARGLGAMGLWLREIDSGRASIGYWLVPSARGDRVAASALRSLVTFAFDVLAIPRLHLFVEPWNVASQRTAEAAGFTQEALLRGWERIDGAATRCLLLCLSPPGLVGPGRPAMNRAGNQRAGVASLRLLSVPLLVSSLSAMVDVPAAASPDHPTVRRLLAVSTTVAKQTAHHGHKQGSAAVILSNSGSRRHRGAPRDPRFALGPKKAAGRANRRDGSLAVPTREGIVRLSEPVRDGPSRW